MIDLQQFNFISWQKVIPSKFLSRNFKFPCSHDTFSNCCWFWVLNKIAQVGIARDVIKCVGSTAADTQDNFAWNDAFWHQYSTMTSLVSQSLSFAALSIFQIYLNVETNFNKSDIHVEWEENVFFFFCFCLCDCIFFFWGGGGGGVRGVGGWLHGVVEARCSETYSLVSGCTSC